MPNIASSPLATASFCGCRHNLGIGINFQHFLFVAVVLRCYGYDIYYGIRFLFLYSLSETEESLFACPIMR